MDVTLREAGQVVILDIEGEVSLLADANDLRQKFKELLAEKKLNVLVNMKGVTYIDSSGLGVLISNYNLFKKEGGALKIANVAGAVKRIFQFSKLDTFFEIFSNEESAVKSWG